MFYRHRISMPKSKKIFYCPGVISLISLLFLFPYAVKKTKPEKLGTIVLNVPKDHASSYLTTETFSSKNFLRHVSGKKKIQVTLNEDKTENSKKLSLIQNEARKIKYTADTEMAIIVTLDNKCDYSNIIALLNICIEDSIKIYALIKNEFIIPGYFQTKTEIERKNASFLMCGTQSRSNSYIKIDTKRNAFYWPFTLPQFISVAILWGAMVILSLMRCKIRKLY